MLEKKKGIDIVSKIGGIDTLDAAMDLFKEKMDQENFSRIQTIKNNEALYKIANAISMCRPDSVFINTGSSADKAFIHILRVNAGGHCLKPGVYERAGEPFGVFLPQRKDRLHAYLRHVPYPVASHIFSEYVAERRGCDAAFLAFLEHRAHFGFVFFVGGFF